MAKKKDDNGTVTIDGGGQSVTMEAERFAAKVAQMERTITHDEQFTASRDKIHEYASNALLNMLGASFLAAYAALEKEVKETASGQVDMAFKLILVHRYGQFVIEGLEVKWSRKVGCTDKNFDPIIFDPNQPNLPGIN